ncbi:MAG: hypothetical protein ACKVS8_10280 [Phycisphaerales bacterium]
MPSSESPHILQHPALAPAGPPAGHTGVIDRRCGLDRRLVAEFLAAAEGASGKPAPAATTGLERRRGAGRRLSDSLRSAEDGSLTREQFLFVKAIDAFKQANGCTFPAWTDVLEVIRLLGYRKTAASTLNLPACEDWHEPADAPSNVRPRGFERRLKKAA